MEYKHWQLKDYIRKTLENIKFEKPTDIQQSVIPLALKGKDIIGRSRTGSGKTHAYLIPILQNIDLDKDTVQAVILSPTRELATQIYEKLQDFVEMEPKLRIKLITGGLDRGRMIEKTENSSQNPHIFIGTPGRIKDIAFQSASINITKANFLVLDEADMILETGFMDDVTFIAGKMQEKLQMLVFSATIPEALHPFLQKYLRNPETIDNSKNEITSAKVEHIAVHTRHRDKNIVLMEVLSGMNPYLALIFATTKTKVDELYSLLKKANYKVGVIHGDLEPGMRRSMMKRINNNEFQYIVASDIAARGIDIEGITHIINYDLPKNELEFYFHRAGRTGRHENDGLCYTLYSKDELEVLTKLMAMGVKFTNKEFKDGVWKDIKPFVREKKYKKDTQISKDIIKVISKGRNQKVKPGYKKKMEREIDTIKRKHRRNVIEADIKRRIVERATIKTKKAKESKEGME